MDKLLALSFLNNKTALLVLMIVLISFVVLLTILGIIFIIALRKRRPVVKVLMSPTAAPQQAEPNAQSEAATASASEDATVASVEPTAPIANTATANRQIEVRNVQKQEGFIVPTYIITAYENVYYTFSPYEICEAPREKRSTITDRSYEKFNTQTRKHEELRIAKLTSKHKYTKHKNGIRIAIARRKVV